jgi:hypothetical protein
MEINLPNLADIERDKKYKVLGVHLDIPYDLDSDGLTLREIRKMKRDDFIKILSNGYVFALNCASELKYFNLYCTEKTLYNIKWT